MDSFNGFSYSRGFWKPEFDVLHDPTIVPQNPGCDQVYLGLPLGECGGVSMANRVIGLLSVSGAVYGNHEPTHGADATELFKQQGASFDTPISEVPPGSTYVISAHGAQQSVVNEAKERGLDVFNVTCPLVHRTHLAIKAAADHGSNVAYLSFGNSEHPETVGARGFAGELKVPFHLVNSLDSAKDLIDGLDPSASLAIIGQTTNNSDEAASIANMLRRQAEAKGITLTRRELQDVCHTVRDRQATTREIVRLGVSSLVVVGSVNSKNTQSLALVGAEEAAKLGTRPSILLVNSWKQLPHLAGTIGVVSGASTLEKNVMGVTEYLAPHSGIEYVGEDTDRDIVFKPVDTKTRSVR